jgi:hypothetical protein
VALDPEHNAFVDPLHGGYVYTTCRHSGAFAKQGARNPVVSQA